MTEVHRHEIHANTTTAERGYSAGVHSNDRRSAGPLDVLALLLAASLIWGPLAMGAMYR